MSYYEQEDETQIGITTDDEDVDEEERLRADADAAETPTRAVVREPAKEAVTRCEACSGTGKICADCQQTSMDCKCVDYRYGREISGFSPVACADCEGTGKTE